MLHLAGVRAAEKKLLVREGKRKPRDTADRTEHRVRPTEERNATGTCKACSLPGWRTRCCQPKLRRKVREATAPRSPNHTLHEVRGAGWSNSDSPAPKELLTLGLPQAPGLKLPRQPPSLALGPSAEGVTLLAGSCRTQLMGWCTAPLRLRTSSRSSPSMSSTCVSRTFSPALPSAR